MASRKSLDSRKGILKEVTDNIKEKGKNVEDIESAYDKTMDKRMEIENDENIDEEVKNAYREKSAEILRGFIEKGEEAAKDLEKEEGKLKEISNENADALNANRKGMEKAQKTDLFVSKFGIDSNTAEKFQSHEQILNQFGGEIEAADQNVKNLINRAKSLSKHRGG